MADKLRSSVSGVAAGGLAPAGGKARGKGDGEPALAAHAAMR